MTRLTLWLDIHLIPQWRQFWKLWSVRLAALFGLIGAYFSDPTNAAMWTNTLYGIPPEYRKLLPGAVFLVLAFVPTAIRLVCQKKLKAPDA
jgi:hypothetical protein